MFIFLAAFCQLAVRFRLGLMQTFNCLCQLRYIILQCFIGTFQFINALQGNIDFQFLIAFLQLQIFLRLDAVFPQSINTAFDFCNDIVGTFQVGIGGGEFLLCLRLLGLIQYNAGCLLKDFSPALLLTISAILPCPIRE